MIGSLLEGTEILCPSKSSQSIPSIPSPTCSPYFNPKTDCWLISRFSIWFPLGHSTKAGRGSNQGRRFKTAVRSVSWDMVGNSTPAGILIEIPGFGMKCCWQIQKCIFFVKRVLSLESFDPLEARADSWFLFTLSDPIFNWNPIGNIFKSDDFLVF